MTETYLQKLDKKFYSFYQQKPFPYVVIDNFLPTKLFKSAVKELGENISTTEDITLNDSTTRNKKTYTVNKSHPIIEEIVNLLSSKPLIRILEKHTGIEGIIPLKDFNVNETGLRFLHEMEGGGFLGSHVDHINIGDNIHFLNSILYLTTNEIIGHGGLTYLHNKFGTKKIVGIEPKPNRLIIFFHSSESFHSVSKLSVKSPLRHTIYMDYYANKKTLRKNLKSIRTSYQPKFWKHRTTFVPLNFSDYWTIRQYLKYFLKKYFTSL